MTSKQVSKWLLIKKRLLTNYDPFWGSLEHSFESLTARNFRDQRSPYGKPWPKPSELTLKLRGVKEGQALRVTGRLQKSNVLHRKSRKLGVFGSNWGHPSILGLHHKGGIITPKSGKTLFLGTVGGKGIHLKRVEIPARPWLPMKGTLPKAYVKALTSAYEKFLRSRMKR